MSESKKISMFDAINWVDIIKNGAVLSALFYLNDNVLLPMVSGELDPTLRKSIAIICSVAE